MLSPSLPMSAVSIAGDCAPVPQHARHSDMQDVSRELSCSSSERGQSTCDTDMPISNRQVPQVLLHIREQSPRDPRHGEVRLMWNFQHFQRTCVPGRNCDAAPAVRVPRAAVARLKPVVGKCKPLPVARGDAPVGLTLGPLQPANTHIIVSNQHLSWMHLARDQSDLLGPPCPSTADSGATSKVPS
jgi:hypothetical protein